MHYGRIAKVFHWIIMALCFYAIGCCGFHILPAWGSSENYGTINNTLLSIALSYVAGYVIFLFTSALPRKQQEMEVFEKWCPHLSDLYNEMSCRIEEVRVFADISKEKMDNLTIEDCSSLKEYVSKPPVISISKTIVREDPKNPLRVAEDFRIKRDLNGHHDTVHQYLDGMLNNPMAMDAERKILDILSQIKVSSFLKECNRIMEAPIINNVQINVTAEDLPKAYLEYVHLRNRLGELPIKKFVFDMRKRTDEEVKEAKKAVAEQLAKMGMTQEMAQEIGQKINEASSRNQPSDKR